MVVNVFAPHGMLITCGPGLEHDVPNEPGNLEFDDSLRQRNPSGFTRQPADVTQQESPQSHMPLCGI